MDMDMSCTVGTVGMTWNALGLCWGAVARITISLDCAGALLGRAGTKRSAPACRRC